MAIIISASLAVLALAAILMTTTLPATSAPTRKGRKAKKKRKEVEEEALRQAMDDMMAGQFEEALWTALRCVIGM